MTPQRRAIGAGLALVLLTLPALALAGPASTPGTPWTGAAAVQRTVHEIMEAQRRWPAKAPDSRVAEVEKEGPDRTHLPQAPGASPVAQWPPAEAGLTAAPAPDGIAVGPFTPILAFDAASLFGANPTFSFPPDNMGAAGPAQYVLFVNGRLVTFNKTSGAGDGVLNVDPDVFFAGINNGSPTSDPRVRYDRLSGRWFLVIINTSTPNSVLIAVSDAASNGVISGATVWSLYSFPIDQLPPAISSTCTADHPTLGIDARALYIGTNNFCGPSQSFNSCDGFVVRKTSVTGGGPIVVTALRGLVPAGPISEGPYAPQGVDNYDPASNEGYFIGVSSTLFGRLILRRVGNPGGTPFVTPNINVTTPATLFPIRVPHLGNAGGASGQLSAVDDRLMAAHLRNGRLWTAHNVGVNHTGASSGTLTRNGSRWYELEGIVSPGTPSLVQSGTVFAPSPSNTTDQPSYWIPSLMVSGQGHVLMGMSTAGIANRIDAAATGRLAGDTPGTMAAPTTFSSSGSAYNPIGDPGGPQGRRWGDYSYTSLDPTDDMTMWSVQQWCDNANSYGCRVIKVRAPLPAAPASAVPVEAGDASVLSTVVGTSTNGSGFHDPGPDPPGVPPFSHVTAVVTADGVTGTPPTVNGVIYVDPTHVVLDLNTTGATPSLEGEMYSVTITNPDGQVATGNQILRIDVQTGVSGQPAPGFALGPVSPNPAPGIAQVDVMLPREARVKVSVVDLSGREVAVLADGLRPAGSHHLAWSPGASRVPAGMYFMRYEAGGGVQVRRFVLLR
ncbi:MAG TPA: T9SS type A sorting domain-containing protein [Candidatus Eisenbacteria bacterium]|nr:T9SS type A sorting domain-containing protein [Candidatus Eisenbacteria bacterium]